MFIKLIIYSIVNGSGNINDTTAGIYNNSDSNFIHENKLTFTVFNKAPIAGNSNILSLIPPLIYIEQEHKSFQLLISSKTSGQKVQGKKSGACSRQHHFPLNIL